MEVWLQKLDHIRSEKMLSVVDLGVDGRNYLDRRLHEGGDFASAVRRRVTKWSRVIAPLPPDTEYFVAHSFSTGGLLVNRDVWMWLWAYMDRVSAVKRGQLFIEDAWVSVNDPVVKSINPKVYKYGNTVLHRIDRSRCTEEIFLSCIKSVVSFDFMGAFDVRNVDISSDYLINQQIEIDYIRFFFVSAYDREGIIIGELAY